jgi:hypothetical protein
MKEKPSAELVIRQVVLLLMELKITIKHKTLPKRLNINAILTFLNSSL